MQTIQIFIHLISFFVMRKMLLLSLLLFLHLTPLLSLELSTLITSSLPSTTITLSIPSEPITVSADIPLSQSLELINPDSTTYLLLTMNSSVISNTGVVDVSFNGFSLVMNGSTSLGTFFSINGANSLTLKNCIIQNQAFASSQHLFLISDTANFSISNLTIQNISFIQQNPNIETSFFGFQEIGLVNFSSFSLQGCQFKNSSLLQVSNSPLSIQSSSFINSAFIISNGLLILESNFSLSSSQMSNLTLDQCFFEISSILSPNLVQITLVSAFENTGDSLLSMNTKFQTNTPLAITQIIISNSSFISQIMRASVLLIYNTASLETSHIILSSCASPTGIYLYGILNATFQSFVCTKNTGTCLQSFDFLYLSLFQSLFMDSTSENYTPGILVNNLDPSTGLFILTEVVFKNLEFSSASSSSEYLGCALYVVNVLNLNINASYFSKNTLLLTNNFYGGPALVFFNKQGSVLIQNCTFNSTMSHANSLSFELTGFNLTVLSCSFLNNSQSERTYSQYTTSIIQGNVNYLTMRYCVLDGNFASQGMLFMTDKDFTVILFDYVHVIHNRASYTSGIYICTETTNKTIMWSNSLIYDVLDQTTMAVILYLYIPNVIDNFIMQVHNVTMQANIGVIYLTPNILKKTSYIAVYWGYTKNINLEFNHCMWKDNQYINPFFSCYGIEKYLIFNVTDSLIVDNDVSFVMITDHTMINVVNTVFLRTIFSLGHIMYSSATESLFQNVSLVDSVFQNFEIFLFTDYSNAIFATINLINVTCETQVFSLANMNSSTISNVSTTQTTTYGFILLSNSTINLIENLYFSDSQINSSVLLSESSVITIFQGLFCQNTVFFNLFSFQSLSFSLNMTQIYLSYPMDITGYSEVFLAIDGSTVSINELNWNLSYAILQSSPVSVTGNSIFSIENSNIFGFQSNLTSIYLFDVDKSQFNANMIQVKRFFSIIWLTNSDFLMTNSFFMDSIPSNLAFPLFCFVSATSLSISQTNFSRVTSVSAFFLIENSILASVSIVSQCIFYKNNASNDNGGGLSASNANLTLSNNIFIRNHALQGGGLYLYCDLGVICNYSLIKNQFSSNIADIDGGALKWKYALPFQSKNSYFNNSANYSNDYSGFFCKIGFIVTAPTGNNNSQTVVFSSFNMNESDHLTIYNVTSNVAMTSQIILYPLDAYNQIVYEQIINRVDLEISAAPEDSDFDCLDQSINLYGKTSQFIDTTQQAFVFDYIIVNACPGRTLMLNFSTNIVNLPANLYSKENSLNENTSNTYSIMIPVVLRTCVPGEIYDRLANQCEECIENYYSFDINDLECTQCPGSATCPGGNQIIVNGDYWRSSETSADLYKCDDNLNNCLGGIDSLCDSDYRGPLCANCVGEKRKNFIGQCKDCPSDFVNFLANCLFYLVLLVILARVLEFVANSSKLLDHRRFLAIQLVHYLHLLFLTQKYNTNGLRSSIELYLTFRSSMWFSLDCFVLMVTESNNFFLSNFLKTLYLYFGFFIYLLFFYLFQRRRKEVTNRSSFYKPLFLYYFCTFPYYLSFFFQQILCVTVENHDLLISETTINCNEAYYSGWAWGFFLPNIFLFLIVLPGVLLFKYFNFSTKNVKTGGSRLKSFLDMLKGIILNRLKFDEFLRWAQKVLLVIVRYSSLQDEDVDLVDFMVLLTFFLVALKFEIYNYGFYRIFSLYLLFIFLINSYFFVVMDFFYDDPLAIGFLIIAILLKLGYYLTFIWVGFFRKGIDRRVNPQMVYMKKTSKEKEKTAGELEKKNSKVPQENEFQHKVASAWN